jgi:hypothetical protein
LHLLFFNRAFSGDEKPSKININRLKSFLLAKNVSLDRLAEKTELFEQLA